MEAGMNFPYSLQGKISKGIKLFNLAHRNITGCSDWRLTSVKLDSNSKFRSVYFSHK